MRSAAARRPGRVRSCGSSSTTSTATRPTTGETTCGWSAPTVTRSCRRSRRATEGRVEPGDGSATPTASPLGRVSGPARPRTRTPATAMASWAAISRSSRSPESRVSLQHGEDRRDRRGQGVGGRAGLVQVRGEQGGGDVARAVGLHRQPRGRRPARRRRRSPPASRSMSVGRAVADHARSPAPSAGPARAPRRPRRGCPRATRSRASVSVRKPSSNWLGVSTSATGTTGRRNFGGIAGLHEAARGRRCP